MTLRSCVGGKKPKDYVRDGHEICVYMKIFGAVNGAHAFLSRPH